MLLQWRRGVRGLEYCTLYIMIREISEIIRLIQPEIMRDRYKDFLIRLAEDLNSARGLFDTFVNDAEHLLMMERLAMQTGHITYEKCDDAGIRKIRTKLFSDSKSHGGLFKGLIDEIDKVLFELITRAHS